MSNVDAVTERCRSAILPRPMHRPLLPLAAAVLLVLALLVPAPAEARTKRRKKPRRPARPHVTRPYYGPPAPTPVPYLRAAGACVEFTPGEYLVLAEIGATGRVFRIDRETEISTVLKKGVRVRVLYVDEAGGPVARKVLPGPVYGPTAMPRTP
jgi:hypothetical protein